MLSVLCFNATYYIFLLFYYNFCMEKKDVGFKFMATYSKLNIYSFLL